MVWGFLMLACSADQILCISQLVRYNGTDSNQDLELNVMFWEMLCFELLFHRPVSGAGCIECEDLL